MSESRLPRRPAMLSAKKAESLVGAVDIQKISAIAHASANLLCFRKHPIAELCELDQQVNQLEFTASEVERFYALLTQGQIAEVAQTWVDMPAQTLPGELWRLYQLYLQIETEFSPLKTESVQLPESDRSILGELYQLCEDFFSAKNPGENPLKDFVNSAIALLKQIKPGLDIGSKELKTVVQNFYTRIKALQAFSAI